MKRKTTPEQKAAAAEKRAALIALSKPLQAARKKGILPWAELPTINACLEVIYSSRTGQNAWHTFMGWKEAGYSVKKGEKGFAIWGRPLDVKRATEPTTVNPAGEEEFSFFPVSYLFHAGQVANEAGEAPPEFRPANPFLAAIKASPLLLMPPADAPLSPSIAA
jgi:hypothetical protein